MDGGEFKYYLSKLKKTQKQMSELLGASLKAIQSYEQNWRVVPDHVERQVFFLLSRFKKKSKGNKPCWTVKKCTPEQRRQCPAWEFSSGDLCWFINGTICEGISQKNWKEKMKTCRSCEVFNSIL
jgi:hypothetical protein